MIDARVLRRDGVIPNMGRGGQGWRGGQTRVQVTVTEGMMMMTVMIIIMTGGRRRYRDYGLECTTTDADIFLFIDAG